MVGLVFPCFCLALAYILQVKWGGELLFMDNFGGILLETNLIFLTKIELCGSGVQI